MNIISSLHNYYNSAVFYQIVAVQITGDIWASLSWYPILIAAYLIIDDYTDKKDYYIFLIYKEI